MSPLTIGSWVTTRLKPGVWRIFRIVEGHNDYDAVTRRYGPSPARLCFVTRFLDGKGQPSFANDSFEASLLIPIDVQALASLTAYADDHLDALAAFEAYPAKAPDRIWNDAISYEGPEALELPPELLIKAREGVTFPEMRTAVAASRLGQFLGSRPKTHVLQWISPAHELRGPDFVYRAVRLLG